MEDAEWPAVDLEADYDADDPGDPDRTHTITTTETEPDFEWAIALRELGLSEEYIAKFEDIPTLRITPESAVLPWSPEVDSPNPFIAVQKALLSDRDRNRKALSSEAYWVGSEESMKYLPHMLLSCLRKTESYIKTFMYQDKSKQERVKNWMDRGSKYHFPGAPNITVGVEEGAMGYNFVNTFRTTEWSPIMLSTEMILSAKNEERLWASFSLSVISYAYFVNNINIESDERVFRARHNADNSVKLDVEKEMQDVIKEAIYYLYGRRGIRFVPPRTGLEMPNDEFLIPSFVKCTKKEWSGNHFVLAMTEYNWVLNEGEKNFSGMMVTFLRQCNTQALEGEGSDRRQEARAGKRQPLPKSSRQNLRRAGQEYREQQDEGSSSAARRSESTGSRQRDAPQDPPWRRTTPEAAAPSDSAWEEQPRQDAPQWKANKIWTEARYGQWEAGTQWSSAQDQWDTTSDAQWPAERAVPKGKGTHNPKGKGRSKGSKDRSRNQRG